MSDWLERLTSSRVVRALDLSARFAEARQRVLADNVANIDTPDYARKRLDPAAFGAALREALERDAQAGGAPGALELRGDAQVSTGPDGRLEIRPVIEPAENILFHDGTHARLERLMTEAAENALHHQFVLNQLQDRFESLLKAIRGRA